jgi:hypothetical protein
MKTIHAALVAAQRGFAPALKLATNPHLKSRYADLASCIHAVVDALNQHGIYLLQRVETDAEQVSVVTVFIHESGESLEAGRLTLPVAKRDPQAYGSAITYARRYSLMSACGIAPEDDDGRGVGEASAPARISQAQVEALIDAAQEVGADLAQLAKYLQVRQLGDLTEAGYAKAVAALERKRKAAAKAVEVPDAAGE